MGAAAWRPLYPLLPLVVWGVLPFLVHRWGAGLPPLPVGPGRWVGLPLLLGGFGLAIASTVLFARRGEGTPVPWDPPRRFVVTGPYRYVRNPMVLGVLLGLLGEALLFASLPILLYTAALAAFAHAWIVLREEPELEARFGETYLVYRAMVPRWLPRGSSRRP
ncbi:MAG: isoprenylcysteine carboxyl methyltransferase [Candidatus Rokubacteria bacterium]|nr:isoprenylcysteine carboxyl methyltransferase [Candidatus Rokubacteria bacterium]